MDSRIDTVIVMPVLQKRYKQALWWLHRLDYVMALAGVHGVHQQPQFSVCFLLHDLIL